MKTFNRNRTLAALALATATFAAPAIAHAGNYNDAGYSYNECKKKDKDNQIVGGLLGAIAGGVLGSQVSGNGARTEGSVIGAAIGAAAGAGIADDNRNCRQEARRTTYSGSTYGRGYSQPVEPAHTYGRTTTRGGSYRTANHRTYRNNRGYNQGYGGQYRSAWEVRQRIELLKDEDRALKRRQKYEYSHWIDRRRDEIRREVKALKRIEDRLEDRRDYRRDYGYNNGRRGHYHGSNICYSDH